MHQLVYIALGGAVGSLTRYFMSGMDWKLTAGPFPAGTLVVNTTGSLMIGLLWGLFEKVDVSAGFRLCLMTGILGGYTTFSSFGLESFNMIRAGQPGMAMAYILGTNVLGLIAVFAGFAAFRGL